MKADIPQTTAFSGRGRMLVTSWACFSTLLAMIVIIGGTIYIFDINARCYEVSSQNETTLKRRTGRVESMKLEYNSDAQHYTEEVWLDKNKTTETCLLKTTQGLIEVIGSLNYRKRVLAVYSPEEDACYILRDIAVDIPEKDDAINLEAIDDIPGEKTGISCMKTPDEIEYPSYVPEGVRTFCMGKPLYALVVADGGSRNGNRTRREKPRRWKLRFKLGRFDAMFDIYYG